MTRKLGPEEVRRRLERLSMEPEYELRETAARGLFEDLKEAAVLIPLIHRDDDLNIVFTKRSEDLEKHSGEVSFPGGRAEPGDGDLVTTALRESFEEVSLHPGVVDVYGALMTMPTVTGYRITAFVGEFDARHELVPDEVEVDVIFEAPLAELARDAVHRIEIREWDGVEFPVHFFDYGEHVVWGATGFMLETLLHYLGYRE